jgi:DinB family protein
MPMPGIETQRIADQLARAVNGPAWHGPSLLELVRDVSPARAAAKPLPTVHSIWELVAHTAAWLEIVGQRLEGTAPRRISETMNWPPVTAQSRKIASNDSTKQLWRADVTRLRRAADNLQRKIRALDDEQLKEDLPGLGDTWTTYITLHGVLQHVLYHAGQIAILKKGTP